MDVIFNLVFKGKNFVLNDNSIVEIKFDNVYKPNSYYKLPSGIERKLDYGYADISKTILTKEVDETISYYIALLKRHKKQLDFLGLEEILLTLTFKLNSQFNWEFDPVMLGYISELGIILAISVYE
jgi:hypothetical protein